MWFRRKSFVLGSAILCSACASSPSPAPAAAPATASRPAAAERETADVTPAHSGGPSAPAPSRQPAAPAVSGASVHGSTLAEAMDRFLALEHARGANAAHVTEVIDHWPK